MSTNIPITGYVGDLAASLRRTQHWKLPDALWAARAAQYWLVLVTHTTGDFKRVGR